MRHASCAVEKSERAWRTCAGRAIVLCCVLAAGGCSTPSLLYQEPFVITEGVRDGLQEYAMMAREKVFAGAANGAYVSYIRGHNGPGRIMRNAMSECQRKTFGACRILDINGQSYEDAYLQYAAQSRQALHDMGMLQTESIPVELHDWKVAPPTAMQTRAQGYGEPTPRTLPGVTTLDTAQLRWRLWRGSITLIDMRGWEDGPAQKLLSMQTIPNAYFVDWGGTEDGAEREAVLLRNFARVMHTIEPDKTKPVCAFCWGPDCWMSINGALRLQALGYTDVHWYRGGIEAWTQAGLPTVNAVPHATVWSE